MLQYLLNGPLLVILPGSAAAAAIGRSFRSGLWACAWAVVLAAPLLIAAWLAEGLRWEQVGREAVLNRAHRQRRRPRRARDGRCIAAPHHKLRLIWPRLGATPALRSGSRSPW
jgi:hypothetical protein